MRILELRFKNLNSLYGEWVIDFTRPEYVQDGIFVITGPTGAGKSTLLDGICLALYGRTPRLKSISKTSNEIMSRQTWECFAEVLFETGSGRFRAHWSQHRAHKKADGNLVDSKHEISEAVTGRILASKKRETALRVIKETGMDFDRFTRAMLLAQGGFAAFLQAAADERAPILEQITGTDIYSQISKKVHERLTEEKDKLKLLKAGIGGIQVLSEEEAADVCQTLALKQKQEKQDQKKYGELSESLAWLLNMERLEKELVELEQASQKMIKEQNAFEQDRIRLKKGLNAAQIDSEYVLLTEKRDQQKKDLNAAQILESSIPDLEKELKLKKEVLNTARKNLDQEKTVKKQQLVLIKAVRKLDFEIGQKEQACKEIQLECEKIEEKIVKENAARVQAKEDQKKKNDTLVKISAYLSEHQSDEGLLSALGFIREKISSLNEFSQTFDVLKKQIETINRAFEKETGRYKKQQNLCRKIKVNCDLAAQETGRVTQEMKNLLDGRSMKGYRSEREGLLREMAYKRKIADLEEERSHLISGKACPLCGSLDHPFAEGQIPKTDEVQKRIDALADILQAVEDIENTLKSLQEKEKHLAREKSDAQNQEKEIQYQVQRLKDQIQQSEKEIQTVREKKDVLKVAVLSDLEPFGINNIAVEDFEAVLQSLDQRVKNFKQYQEQKSRIEKELNELAARIKQSDGVLDTLGANLDDKKSVLKDSESFLKAHRELRRQQYGQKDPEIEEARMEASVAAAVKAEELAAGEKEKINQVLATQRARKLDLQTAMAARQSELHDLEKIFIQKLVLAEFKDEAQFISCRLLSDEKNALTHTAQTLDEKQRDIFARTKDRKEQLEKQMAKKRTSFSFDHLEKELEKLKSILKETGESIGALKHKLSENNKAMALIEGRIKHITAREKECSRWGALHELIGSADGKKYRNFAQGITFELMVSYANQQLKKMSDRYLLARDEQLPLELNIVDDYQAGEIRSTKNLSGGESFIVSLSLALGLSNMASGNVRVDSLFLDEGFGTLDEDALETALQALAGLHRSGKLIGVISHVPALKESISTQIQIWPVSGGKSRVSGPGCNG